MVRNVELMTVAEAGRALGVSESTVRRRIRRGTLASVRTGGRRLVLWDPATRSFSSESLKGVPPLTLDNPIFRLVGAGRGGGQPPGARDKHTIIGIRQSRTQEERNL